MNFDDISTIGELIQETGLKMHEIVENLPQVSGKDIGLDDRAGYNLKVSVEDGFIIATTESDKSLQYYGGFEYIGVDHRMEIAGYVIYSAESSDGVSESRVVEAIAHYTGDFSNVEGFDEYESEVC